MFFPVKHQPSPAQKNVPHTENETLRQQLATVQQQYRELELKNEDLARRLEISEKNASTDELTSIPNRRITTKDLITDLSDVERNYFDLVVVQIDLDHFKSINDSFGHEQGDTVLVDFTRAIQQHLRKSDHFGRWGGEEFILCLPMPPGTSQKEIEELFSRYQDESASVNRSPNKYRPAPLTISLGAVVIRSGTKNLDFHEVLRQVDKALYESKKTRDTFTLNIYQDSSFLLGSKP